MPDDPPTTSLTEVARVLRVQRDYYAVLRIEPGQRGKQLSADAVRAAARGVALHVHPDRAASRGVPPSEATAAAAVVNTAAATLADPMKRRLYDAWEAGKEGGGTATATFAEWEAGAGFAHLPVWLRRLLARRGGAVCVAVTGLILLVPILVVLIILTILCLPVRGVLWCCGVRGGEGGEGAAAGDVEMGATTPAAAAADAGGGSVAGAVPTVIVLEP